MVSAYLKIAWQDSRGSRGKLFLFLSSLVLGIAALVLALLLRSAIELNLDSEAKSLLGADLALRAKTAPEATLVETFRPKRLARETQIRSMALFGAQDTRLVQVRAFSGQYPFYGEVRTKPADIWQNLLSLENAAVVDEALLIQAGSKIGETVKLGAQSFTILGIIEKFPGSLSISGAVAPRIYISERGLEATQLLGKMSVADHFLYADFGALPAPEALKALRERLPEEVQLETVADRRERLGRVNEQLSLFLGLVAVICIALGGVGAGIALFFYLRAKASVVALLRCLGASGSNAILVVFVQVCAAATLALAFGLSLGVMAYKGALVLLAALLKFELIAAPLTTSLLLGFGLGAIVVFLAAAPGLFLLKNTRALDLLRSGQVTYSRPIVASWISLVLLTPFLLLWTLGLEPKQIVGVGAVIVLSIGVLWLFARIFQFGFEWLQRKSAFIFEIKHALRRLGRNRGSSGLLLVALALTTILLTVILTVRATLVGNVAKVRDENTANLFVYDVGPEDVSGVKALLADHKLSVSEDVPIILMRITKLKGRGVSEILNDQSSGVPSWTLRREYWSSFRSELISNEEIVAGKWFTAEKEAEVIPISIEDRLARNLGVWVGDQIEFSIQGVKFTTYIASVRKIYWEQMRRNAFVIFPQGVLEDAPQFRFLTVFAPDMQQTAGFQRALAQQFPGVSAIDLRHAVETVFELLNKIILGIAVLVSLVTFTALVLLVIMLMSARAATTRETALLRTLGATVSQVRLVFFLEQFVLALSAVCIALPITWAASRIVALALKRSDVVFPWPDVLLLSGSIIAFVLIFAWMVGGRGVKEGLAQAVRAET